MTIHVVSQGETIQQIADLYDVPAGKLIQDNGIPNPKQLVTGQSIVIAYPESVYTVKPGDTLLGIAMSNGVSYMDILRNNPFLSEREFIYPDEELVISYPQDKGTLSTHAIAIPFISLDTLKKTLPYLTYLSILNYTATNEGHIIKYYDDKEMIQLTKGYGVMPLMFLTTLTLQGDANIVVAFDILLNEDFQNKQIENVLVILEESGYSGVNISFEYINSSNLKLYEKYFSKIMNALTAKGYLVFITIRISTSTIDNKILFEDLDYSIINQITDRVIFMNYELAANMNPPSPVSSVNIINEFLDYVLQFIPTKKVTIGLSTIGYDWELPFSAGVSKVNALTAERAIELARIVGATIQFDEESQTPYFNYTVKNSGTQINHIVWFIDARSINAILDLVSQHKLNGAMIQNITIYNSQIWLLMNSQYKIQKSDINFNI